jgi:peptide/nickel transport system ATP-binding protein
MPEPLLSIDRLTVTYPARGFRARPFTAVHDVSLDVRPGETVGLVGESGSGKSSLGRAILGLAPVSAGNLRYHGNDIGNARPGERRKLAGDLQVVFQDPYSSLNPALTIETILMEPLLAGGVPRREAAGRIRELLDAVGLPRDSLDRLPREFSGGQRQRIAIARALSVRPRLIVCDEPVSALDLSTQARVLRLFREIQERTGVAYLFISHDLSVVRHLSHRVAVMFRGVVVEWGDCAQVTERPQHPYTQRLLLAAPIADPLRQAERRERWLAVRSAPLDAARMPRPVPGPPQPR